MMLEHMGWHEAADAIIRGLEKSIANKTVTYDFARLMEGAEEVKCSRVRRPHHQEHVMSTSTIIWIFTGIVFAGTLAWNLRSFVKDRRESRDASADFAKTRLAAEIREKHAKPPKKPRR